MRGGEQMEREDVRIVILSPLSFVFNTCTTVISLRVVEGGRCECGYVTIVFRFLKKGFLTYSVR